MIETSDANLWVVASGLLGDGALESVTEDKAEAPTKNGVSIGKASAQEGEGSDSEEEVVVEKRSSVIEAAVPPQVLAQAISACVMEIMNLDFSDVPYIDDVGESVKFRVGIHSGSAIGGLVGKKVPLYSLNGDAVSTAYGLCATAVSGTVQLSGTVKQLLVDDFEAEEKSIKLNVCGYEVTIIASANYFL